MSKGKSRIWNEAEKIILNKSLATIRRNLLSTWKRRVQREFKQFLFKQHPTLSTKVNDIWVDSKVLKHWKCGDSNKWEMKSPLYQWTTNGKEQYMAWFKEQLLITGPDVIAGKDALKSAR